MAASSTETPSTGGTKVPAKLRESLNGRWILDRGRSQSMSAYLRTMDVPDMAIQAHEKGEVETETYHTITLTDKTVKIVKRSRVNDDVVVELTLGEEKTEMLRAWSTDRSVKNPEQRPKKAIATTDDHGRHLRIENKLLTVNGMAHVIDTKRLIQEDVAAKTSNKDSDNIDTAVTSTKKEERDNVEGKSSEDGAADGHIDKGEEQSETRSVLVQELVITNEVTGATNTTTRYFLPYDGKLEGEDDCPAYNDGSAGNAAKMDTDR